MISNQPAHIFSVLSSDSVYDICKFMSVLDVVFNVRSVCRATYQCINIDEYSSACDDGDENTKEYDDRYIRLIETSIEGYEKRLKKFLHMDRLLNEREKQSYEKEEKVDRRERARIKIRKLLRFRYIEMVFKPNEDNHFMIRVTRSSLRSFNPDQKDSDTVTEQFNGILREFKKINLYQSISSQLEHENDYVVLTGVLNGGKPYINELYSFNCKFKQNEPTRISITNGARILSLASERSSNYFKYHTDFRLFLDIIDSIFSRNYLDTMSAHVIIMISQQEFVIPNRQLIVDLQSSFDYGIEDAQVKKVRDVPCTLFCNVNPFGRELIYSSSAIKKNLKNNLGKIALFCGLGIYLGGVQYFTNITAFRFTREYFTSNSTFSQIMAWLLIGIDCLFGLASTMYFSESILELSDSFNLALCTYAAKWVVCGIHFGGNPWPMLKYLHIPPLEIAHNVAGFGFLAVMGLELFKDMDALITSALVSLSHWTSKYFNPKKE